MSELLYKPEKELENPKSLYLGVLTLDFPSDLELAERAVSKAIGTSNVPDSSTACDSEKKVALSEPKRAKTDDKPYDGTVKAIDVKGKEDKTQTCDDPCSPAKRQGGVSGVLNELLENYVLDIDLDFYSTCNPFKLMLTPEQYILLKEIYTYTPPKDHSEEVS